MKRLIYKIRNVNSYKTLFNENNFIYLPLHHQKGR